MRTPSWPAVTADQRRAVEARFGDAIICQRCGCTLGTYGATCSAKLTDSCEGFEAIEAALKEAE